MLPDIADNNTEFFDNTGRSRFEYHIADKLVFANYRLTGDTLYIDYVEAEPALRGTDAAGQLMRFIMQHALNNKLKVTPICGYAAAWLRKNA